MLSQTEENYLKALFHLTVEDPSKSEAGTNELASHLNVKPATANDMLKKLKEKNLINHEKYGKIKLTKSGKKNAIELIRKHRLWETFLYEKLNFTWDEVHEVAEQLEHIHSEKLIQKLDEFLNFPKVDPHGDAIPNAKGELEKETRKSLAEMPIGKLCKMVAVKDNSAPFLQYVMQLGLGLKSKIKVLAIRSFDDSLEIEVNQQRFGVSKKFAEKITVI